MSLQTMQVERRSEVGSSEGGWVEGLLQHRQILTDSLHPAGSHSDGN